MQRSCMLLMILIAGFVGGCDGTPAKIERAVAAALAPETSPDVWTPVLKSPSSKRADMLKGMGSHNFTSFLFAITDELDRLAKGYSWEFDPRTSPALFAQYLIDHSTLVAAKDVRDLQWARQPNGTFSGSFSVDTSYGLKAKMLFAASEKDGAIAVTKLVVARKQSTDLAEGFTIFEKQ